MARDKKQQIDISTMQYGKIPPQARELEDAILGTIMMERDAFDIASEILKPNCFYSEGNQKIYQAMQSLAQKSQPIDIFTITEELRFREDLEMVGGPYNITRLTNAVVSSANLESHCRIVLEKYMQRELIQMGGQLVHDGYENQDVFSMMETHEQKFTSLITSNVQSTYTDLGSDLAKSLTHISELRAQPSHITGIPSGFVELDRITHGWQDTDLIILAARPSVGKTALALNFMRNAARENFPIGFFSLEMSKSQITNRHLSAESGVFLDNILTGRVDNEQWEHICKVAGEQLARFNIYTDDTAALNIFQVRSIARRMKRKHKIRMIIIDYLQLMSGIDNKGNREQEISKISRDLKALAKELHIPIIALSQLSRKTEDRKGDKTPQLADLRESGAIEQDADLVMFLYRPEYYDVKSVDGSGEVRKGETHVKIAKHRNGTLDTIKLQALLHIQKFITMEGESSVGKIETPWATDITQPKSEQVDLPF